MNDFLVWKQTKARSNSNEAKRIEKTNRQFNTQNDNIVDFFFIIVNLFYNFMCVTNRMQILQKIVFQSIGAFVQFQLIFLLLLHVKKKFISSEFSSKVITRWTYSTDKFLTHSGIQSEIISFDFFFFAHI